MIVKNNKEWHRIVCERDGYTCCVCGTCYDYESYLNQKGVNQAVAGHHILTRGARKDLELETDNGICVCNTPSIEHPEGCHNAIHNGSVYLKAPA